MAGAIFRGTDAGLRVPPVRVLEARQFAERVIVNYCGSVPFRVAAMTTPNHLLAWLRLLDHHPEDHLPLVETEFGFAARLLIRRRVGGPPAA